MFRFFRKIRKNSVPEKAFGQYLLYALGEIVLVVIGILLALQINNWNEERQNTARDRIMLAHLMEENASNMEQLEAYRENRESLDDTITSFIVYLRSDTARLKSDSCRRYLAVLSNAESYSFSENYLQWYINGTLQDHSEVTRELVALHGFQKDLNFISEKCLDHRLKNFFTFLEPEVDFYNLSIRDTNLLASLDFRNKVVLIKALEQEVTNQFFRTLDQQKKVDSLIRLRLGSN